MPSVAFNTGRVVEYRWRVVQEILETCPRSEARRFEVERAARKWALSIRTVQRWLQAVERSDDLDALRSKAPRNRGQRRVWVSRRFDRDFLDAGLDGKLLPLIGFRADQLIRAAWASPVQRAGWKQVRREVVLALQRYTRELKFDLPPAAFELSQRRIRDARHYRVVDVRAHDRKRYDDERPRIRRRNDVLRPMQQIVMDVKVVDCAVSRTDGTCAWPRMVAFMDTGTHRIFRRFFLLKPGEGIRQEHVVRAFLDMVSDLDWGFPEQLYRDNGAEFQILDNIRSALEQLRGDNVRTIINARPYAAASKPIESKFAVLDRFVFSQMGGWAGGDRMRLKTHCLGKPPTAYGGSFADFISEANDRIRIFEDQTIGSGLFAGRSPREIFAQHKENGWRSLLVNTGRLDAAFCTRQTRRVSRGSVSIGGCTYRHRSLINGCRVIVALPWRRGAEPLAFVREFGWCVLESDLPYAPTAVDGARESQKRAREHDSLTRALQQEAGVIDLEANRRDRLAMLGTEQATAAVVDTEILPSESSLSAAMGQCKTDRHLPRIIGADARAKKTRSLEEFLGTTRR